MTDNIAVAINEMAENFWSSRVEGTNHCCPECGRPGVDDSLCPDCRYELGCECYVDDFSELNFDD